MSASLVGSEMCIRDSHPTSGHRPRGASPSTSGARGPGPRLEADVELPVSYTHLTLPTICSV
eukprot:3619742-Alexandrium_andersonii.AAC.1